MDILSLLIGLIIGVIVMVIVSTLINKSNENANQTNIAIKNEEIQRLRQEIGVFKKQIEERTASNEKYRKDCIAASAFGNAYHAFRILRRQKIRRI